MESGQEQRIATDRELEKSRHPLASETRRPLFRVAERWLEFLVRQDATRLDSKLKPQFAYAQSSLVPQENMEFCTFCQ